MHTIVSARLLGGFALFLILTGCTGALPAAPPPSTPSVAATFTPIPTYTAAPATTTASLPTRLPTEPVAFGTLYVTVTADNVNLRTRPGTVFPVSRLLAKGTRLQLLGHAPGAEWLLVQTDSKIQGWLLHWLVKGGNDGGPMPEVTPADVQVVSGQVLDRAGLPISGVGFAVSQANGSAASRTDATTDETGHFYAFLPASANGTWRVSYVSIACTSNTMDTGCNCIGTCGRSEPDSVTISLPAPTVLQFTWR